MGSTPTKVNANERRNSQYKHGGGPQKTASRRVLSDDELDALDGMSDDELDALEEDQANAPPILRKDEKTGGDERQAAQAANALGLGLGVGDEVVGAMAAIGEFARTGDVSKAAKAYDSEQKYAEDVVKRWRAQPDTTTGDYISEGAGFLASAPLGVGVFKAAGAIPKVVRAVGAGAKAGAKALRAGEAVAPAVKAAAKAAGPTTRLGRAVDTGTQLAATGAAFSEGNVIGNAPGGVAERYAAARAAGYLPSLVGAGLGVGAGVLGAGGVKVAQNVAGRLASSDSRAARYIAEKLIGAGQTADDLAAAQAKAAETGKPVALADVGPQGVKDAAGAAARAPGPGRDTAQGVLVPRQEGQVARVSEDVGNAVGGKPGSFTKTVDEISAARAEQAKPLYDKALGNNAPVKSPKIVEITNRPSGKAAMQRGLKIAQDEGIPLEELVITDANGNVVGYSAKALHYMKMGLDDMIESAVRSGDKAAARAYTIMKNELLTEMDRTIPGYAQARKVFAGHAAQQRALEQGREAVTKHPDQIKSEMAGMTEGEREMYRRGYAQKIIEDVERSPDAGNAARRIFGNTAKRERLRAVLGDEEYNRLAEKLGVEEAMYKSYARANVGSDTAERVASQGDIDEFAQGELAGTAAGMAQSYASGTIAPLLHRIGMSGIARLLRGLSTRVRGSIAKLLFSTNPNDVRRAIAMIRQEYGNALKAKQTMDAAIAASAANPDEVLNTAAAGSAAGSAVGGAALDATAPVSPFW